MVSSADWLGPRGVLEAIGTKGTGETGAETVSGIVITCRLLRVNGLARASASSSTFLRPDRENKNKNISNDNINNHINNDNINNNNINIINNSINNSYINNNINNSNNNNINNNIVIMAGL